MTNHERGTNSNSPPSTLRPPRCRPMPIPYARACEFWHGRAESRAGTFDCPRVLRCSSMPLGAGASPPFPPASFVNERPSIIHLVVARNIGLRHVLLAACRPLQARATTNEVHFEETIRPTSIARIHLPFTHVSTQTGPAFHQILLPLVRQSHGLAR